MTEKLYASSPRSSPGVVAQTTEIQFDANSQMKNLCNCIPDNYAHRMRTIFNNNPRAGSHRRCTPQARLSIKLGGADLVCRATNLFEAQVDERQLSLIAGDSQWQLTFPTYAEIRKPATNLNKLREKLAEMK